MFSSGRLAYYFAPSWRFFEIKETNPNLNFAIAAVPQLPESREIYWEKAEAGEAKLTNVNWASFWVEGVSSFSPNQKEAWDFLSYLGSEEGLRQFHALASQTRDFGEIYPKKNLAEELAQIPYLKPFVDQAKTAQSWYMCSFTHDDTLNDAIAGYYKDAVGSVLAGGDFSSISTALSSGVGQVLQQYRIPQ